MHVAAAEVVLLADSEVKKAGPLALAIVLALFIACYFLFRSMAHHLRKVRTEFPVDSSSAEPPSGSAPDKTVDGTDKQTGGSPGTADSTSPRPSDTGPPAD